MVYSLVQFSKSLVYWLESDACVHSSGVRLEVHKQIYGVTFLSFSFSVVPVLSNSSSLPFLILWPESWDFSYHIQLVSCTVPKPGAKQQREKKATEFCHSLGITAPLLREEGFPSSVLGA